MDVVGSKVVPVPLREGLTGKNVIKILYAMGKDQYICSYRYTVGFPSGK